MIYMSSTSSNDGSSTIAITLGETQGNMVAVTKGIGENDTIIAGNLQKTGPGALVRVAPPARTGA
jgi:multidrug efflux system membrane fusion protein